MFMIDLGAPSYYSILGISPDADTREVRASQAKLAGDLKRQFDKARTPEDKRDLEVKQERLNAIESVLASPEKRAQYDENNVHLTFFQIRKVAAPVLLERELLMRWMHQAVFDFLRAKGEPMEPISDLERSDFTRDFSPNDLLDDVLRQVGEGRG